MCQGKLIEDLDLTAAPLFENLVIDDFTDSDNESESLLANEEMLESDTEIDVSSDVQPEINNLFRRNMMRMNIGYNINMYDDLVTDCAAIHGSALVHKIIVKESTPAENYGALMCHSCYIAGYINASFSGTCHAIHFMLTGDEFASAVRTDLEYLTCEYFCAACDRFIWDIETNINSDNPIFNACACVAVYNDSFLTNGANTYFDEWIVGFVDSNGMFSF